MYMISLGIKQEWRGDQQFTQSHWKERWEGVQQLYKTNEYALYGHVHFLSRTVHYVLMAKTICASPTNREQVLLHKKVSLWTDFLIVAPNLKLDYEYRARIVWKHKHDNGTRQPCETQIQ